MGKKFTLDKFRVESKQRNDAWRAKLEAHRDWVNKFRNGGNLGPRVQEKYNTHVSDNTRVNIEYYPSLQERVAISQRNKDKVDDKVAKSFIEGWLGERKHILGENISNDKRPTHINAQRELNRQLKNMNNTPEVGFGVNPQSSIIDANDDPWAERQARNVFISANEREPKNIAEIQSMGDTAHGIYLRRSNSPENNVILYPTPNRKLDDSMFQGTRVHEDAHALDPFYQKRAISNLQEDNYHLNNVRYDNYLDSPTEIYARLMQFRFHNKIDPNKVWTLDEIKELRSDTTKFDRRLFDRYSDEFILNLFNKVADSDNKSDSINLAPLPLSFNNLRYK